MSMEKFFENNIYVLFSIIIYYLLLSEKPKNDNQKIIVIYIFIAMLSIFNILDLKYMILILLLCTYIYFEFLIDDNFKYKILRKLLYKTIDFLYLVIIKYNILMYVVALIFISDSYNKMVNIPFIYNFIIFILILIKVISKITDNDFELFNFSEVYNQLNKIKFSNYEKLNNDKIKILTTIEDKSFFERKEDYTFICWDFLKYRLNRINEVLQKVQDRKYYKHNLKNIIKFIKYVLRQLYYQLKDIENYKNIIRGYSTIEMQLFRTIGVKNGYQKVFQRKVTEFIYTQLFFKGLKNYYKLNYTTVSNNYFKNLILVNYVEYAPVIIAGKYIKISELWNKKVNELNNSEFFLSILGLSGKIKKNNLNFNYIIDRYPTYISKFLLDEKELKKAIKELNKRIK